MTPGGHRLLGQLGAGPDGVAYRAIAPGTTDVVELRVLTHARERSPEHWANLSRHLRRAALLDHPGALRLCGLHLDDDPPHVVLEWHESVTLEDTLQGSPRPYPAADAVPLLLRLAEVLAEAHRLGLVHGRLAPRNVLLAPGNVPLLDFTDLRVRSEDDTAPSNTDPAEDIAALGRLLRWLLAGAQESSSHPDWPVELSALIPELTHADPERRPSVATLVRRLRDLFTAVKITCRIDMPTPKSNQAATVSPEEEAESGPLTRERLGRFRVLRLLGQGGMGAVYLGEDPADGSRVALKVLRRDAASSPAALRRFLKEARLLAEVRTPYVANLLEVNEDDGIHYLAMEYVEGASLDELLKEQGRLAERQALAIMADIARGLVEAHARGIVHRDIKPSNILLERRTEGGERTKQDLPDSAVVPPPTSVPRAKLTDFGLARHVVETESLAFTRTGAIMGTPFYMAPEQCTGLGIDARSDIYSMGATLYHLLAGEPPFQAESSVALLLKHTREPPPPLRQRNPDLSEAVCAVVDKALAKAPDARYPDAAAILEDLERLLRGEPTRIVVHPVRPSGDPRRVVRYEFVWELKSTPQRLWPYVSNTERLNRAIGLDPVQWKHEKAEEAPPGENPIVETGVAPRVQRSGSFRKVGMEMAWHEHPFEWIEGRRLGVLREFDSGPFKWFVSVVELTPNGEGTRLTHRIEIEPHGLLGRTIVAVEVGLRTRRSLERVYRRIDASLTGAMTGDPFEGPATLTRAQTRELEHRLDELALRRVAPDVAEALADFLATAPAPEVARIRPLALAARLGLDPEATVACCLHAARVGLLVLLWDILCPVCRVPAAARETLKALRDHEHCEACASDFGLDLGSLVEVVFRAHPEVRDSELASYCLGGPANAPHVAAQTRIAPGERIDLELALGEGAYRLRGPQIPYHFDFIVAPGAGRRRLDLNLARGLAADEPHRFLPGSQVFALVNDSDGELVIRFERMAARTDALTAAQATALALFRELFPDQVLASGRLLSVATMTLLTTDLADAEDWYARLGDSAAFVRIHEHFGVVREVIRREGGALVKTVGERALAAFTSATAAVRAALALQAALDANEATQGLKLRVGVHRGPALTATVNDQLDYFGATARLAQALPALALAGGVVLSSALTAEPEVTLLLQARRLTAELVEGEMAGGERAFLVVSS